MGLLKSHARLAPLPDAGDEGASSRDLYQRLETLLVSGGDARLALSRPGETNAYGCAPFPRPRLPDFASSTASGISEYAYAAAEWARMQFLRDAASQGVAPAFEAGMERARVALKYHLGIADAEIIFSPSGTDAQLQALFVAKTFLGKPLVTIVVGSDQTGSGTLYTARGLHFSDSTARKITVRKGAPIMGRADQVRSLGIPFCDDAGHLRSSGEMDEAVTQAVAEAAGNGEKVLLQIMDASKLGWRAPSMTCVERIMASWPGQVCVVVDACQMRLGRARLGDYLARNFLVLMTGSKFFTGPAFSGALLVPALLTKSLDTASDGLEGLAGYSTRYDWPRRWPRLRAALTDIPNYGQWLRWEASLAEMRAYFAVPGTFRDAVLGEFGAQVPKMIEASRHLRLLERPAGVEDQDGDAQMPHPTIFSFVAERGGNPLTLEESGKLYRAMGRDVSGFLPDNAADADKEIAARPCQIGQPVALRHQAGAALRLSSSARLVTESWSRGGIELMNVQAVIEKLDWLIDHPEILGGTQ